MAEDPKNPFESQPQPPGVQPTIVGPIPASPEAQVAAEEAAKAPTPEQGLEALAGTVFTPTEVSSPQPAGVQSLESPPAVEEDKTLIADYLAGKMGVMPVETLWVMARKHGVDPIGKSDSEVVNELAQRLGVGQSEASEAPPETISSETLRTDVSDVRSMPEAEGPARRFVEQPVAEVPPVEEPPSGEPAADGEGGPQPLGRIEPVKKEVPKEIANQGEEVIRQYLESQQAPEGPEISTPEGLSGEAAAAETLEPTAPAATVGGELPPEGPTGTAEAQEPLPDEPKEPKKKKGKEKSKGEKEEKDQFKDLKDFIAQRDAERDRRWEEELKKLRDELENVKSKAKTTKPEKEGFRGRRIEGVKFPSIKEWAELSEKERIDFIKKAIRTEAASVTDAEARDIIRHLDRDQTNDPEYSAKVAAAAIYKDSHGGLTNRERNRLMLTNPEVGLLLAERYESLDKFRKTAEKLGLKGFSFSEWFSETLREHGPKAATAILILMSMIAAGAVGPSVIRGVTQFAK